MVLRFTLILALPLLTASCLSGTFSRFDVESEPDPATLERLSPGESDLDHCLTELGAPLLVRELSGGAVLVWGGRQDSGWNITFDVPLGNAEGAFSYSRDRGGLRGAVLFFDASWQLTHLQRGWLSDILPDELLRPQSLELIEE